MRQLARVHKSFYRLKLRANFFVGNRVFEKTSFCTARFFGPGTVTHEVFAPWTVVRSDEYVNKKITPAQLAELNANARARNEQNKKIMAKYTEGLQPYTKEQLEGTPYTGGHFADGVIGNVGPCGVDPDAKEQKPS